MSVDTDHALIDLKTLKELIGEDRDKYNKLLEWLIDSVSLYLENECDGRIFIEATYTDALFDGTGNSQLYLPNYPITAVASVYEDDDLLVVGRLNDYVIKGDEGEGYLERIGDWSEGVDNVKVTYTAGYTLANVPRDLKDLCVSMIGKEYQKRINKAGVEATRSFPDMSITWDFGQDEYVKKIIKKFTREHIY